MSEAEKSHPAAPEPGAQAPGMQHEADIGSGEKTPGERETEEMIKAIPPLPSSQGDAQAPDRAVNQADKQAG